MVSQLDLNVLKTKLTHFVAEFRGPGVHHNFDDSDSGYDVEMERKGFGSNSRGRIILLGDGSEVLTNSDDSEMFDHADEDKDLESQVKPSSGSGDTTIPEKLSSSPEATYKGVAEDVLSKTSGGDKPKSS